MKWERDWNDPLTQYLQPFATLIGDRRTWITCTETVRGIIGSRIIAKGSVHMLKALGQKAACATGRIIDRLANCGINYFHHGADDFARGEELPTIIALLAHLEQQTFIDL